MAARSLRVFSFFFSHLLFFQLAFFFSLNLFFRGINAQCLVRSAKKKRQHNRE